MNIRCKSAIFLLAFSVFALSGNEKPATISLPETVFVKGSVFQLGASEEQMPEQIEGKKAYDNDECQTAKTWFLIAVEKGNNAYQLERLEEYAAPRCHPAEPEMVFVQGGSFTMGCTAGKRNKCLINETPPHTVTVGDFQIGKYEITQGQWKALMGANPSFNQRGDDYPVENVSWNNAQEFISRLNELTGKQYRLPTEAEWEYAAGGGVKSRGYKYSGSAKLKDVAWYKNNSRSETHPVGAKLPNELGVYDMCGNVWEWCNDWYGAYSDLPKKDPTGASSGSYRVLRGGNYIFPTSMCRIKSRSLRSPEYRFATGFRVALTDTF